MRREFNSGTDRLYLAPSYSGTDGDGAQVAFPGFQNGRETGRVPVLPVNLYDLGVSAGEARGGRGAAPIAARMLVNAGSSAIGIRPAQFTIFDIRDYPTRPQRSALSS